MFPFHTPPVLSGASSQCSWIMLIWCLDAACQMHITTCYYTWCHLQMTSNKCSINFPSGYVCVSVCEIQMQGKVMAFTVLQYTSPGNRNYVLLCFSFALRCTLLCNDVKVLPFRGLPGTSSPPASGLAGSTRLTLPAPLLPCAKLGCC